MRTASKIAIVNVGTVVGCAIVALTLPLDTPVLPFGIVCLATLIVMNGALVFWPLYRKHRGMAVPASKSTTAKLILIWVIFLAVLILNWWNWRRH